MFFFLVNTHTYGSKWRLSKNTCLLFKCIWKKIENSGKIREFCQEQNVETMNNESAEEWDRINQVFLIKIMIGDYTIDYKTNSPLQPL